MQTFLVKITCKICGRFGEPVEVVTDTKSDKSHKAVCPRCDSSCDWSTLEDAVNHLLGTLKNLGPFARKETPTPIKHEVDPFWIQIEP